MKNYKNLFNSIKEYCEDKDANISVSFCDLNSDLKFEVEGDKISPSASMIKLLIMATVLREVDRQKLNLEDNKDFVYDRKPIPKTSEMTAEEHNELIKKNLKYGKIICRCEKVTEGEILDAIHAPVGATTVDGIKRRCRATAGRCQGGFCLPSIIEILSRELGVDQEEITKKGNKSTYIEKRVK